ncbi:MAG: PC4/YdbC family ssDNA-binding protein [Treponemataceae bacterium]|nr:MAG: PC4/YdbC family ssDNA-binding protein [Treponemataceae bacterium]
MAEFTYEITKKIAVISEGKTGWKTELNMVAWNGRESKYDIRSWSPDGQRMGKGISLTAEELTALKKTLNELGEV